MALSQAKILIVGAGEMAQLAGQALKMHNAENISVINRTYSSATELAAELGAIPLPWHQLDDALIAADLVITATGAPHLVIHRTEVEAALTTRQDRSMIFMDVAVPRDVDPEVSLLEGVFCYDVDDLQSTVDENMAQRQAEIPKVEAIIVQEVANMLDWISQRKVVPVIIDIRSRAKEIAEAEVADAKRRLRNLDPHAAEVAEELLERLAHRLVNKLLHQPTIQLKERATTGESADYAYMVRELFQLNSTVPLPTPSTAVEALSLQSSSLQTPA